MRSKGYRAKKAVKADVEALRAQLGKCHKADWAKASIIMHHLTTLLGHAGGPMGGKIEPRACKFCGYYGHTKRYCERRKAAYEAQLERMAEQDREEQEKWANWIPPRPYDPRIDGQAVDFNNARMPFRLDPDLGALVATPGDVCVGDFVFDEAGRVVRRSE